MKSQDFKEHFQDFISELEADIQANNSVKVTAPDFCDENEKAIYEKLGSIIEIINNLQTNLENIKISINSSKKLESLGTMAAGMAHEFNNVLQPITGFADIMMQHEGLPKVHYEWLDIILQSANRGTGLVDQIMNFSRKDRDVKKNIVSFNSLVADFFEMISMSVELNIDIELDNFLEEDANVYVNKSEMMQVLINLYNNAQHAVSKMNPGTIKILAYSDSQTVLTENLKKHLVIEVSDNGYGIPEESMEKIFEPFYTTKQTGEGTGLGLSIIKNIIDASGGSIHVSSEQDIGTTFKIKLPEYIGESTNS